MSNNLSMSKQEAIAGLMKQGWSQHRIARETGFDHKTVSRHAQLARERAANSPISTAGSAAGRQSQCVPVEAHVRAGLESGLTAQRIYQDLVTGHQFLGSCQTVTPAVYPQVPFEKKDIDIVMLANFRKYKRHFALFKALRDMPHTVKVVCIGQHNDKRTRAVLLAEATA